MPRQSNTSSEKLENEPDYFCRALEPDQGAISEVENQLFDFLLQKARTAVQRKKYFQALMTLKRNRVLKDIEIANLRAKVLEVENHLSNVHREHAKSLRGSSVSKDNVIPYAIP